MSYQVYKEYLERYHAVFGTKKMYVIAYFSAHLGELTQVVNFAESELDAANWYLGTEFDGMGMVHEYCVNSDSWINVLEINDTLTE
jgi:hypothetical protein